MTENREKLNGWQKLFLRFLKENNAYYEYIRLTSDNIWRVFKDQIDLYVCSGLKGWNFRYSTEDKQIFWKEIDLKWVICIYDNYDNFSWDSKKLLHNKSEIVSIIHKALYSNSFPIEKTIEERCKEILLEYNLYDTVKWN